jgi:electron transfer flavoprotein alpha subunit
MPRIFVYIAHKNGVVDDSASTLSAAAKQIDAAELPTAILSGFGPALNVACDSLRNSFNEIWKVENEACSYPNAELIRKALVKILPPDAVLLVPHDHFGIDLSPGLSILMDLPFVSDVVNVEGVDGTILKVVRQEFGGQVSAHVCCDISAGAVINVRAGSFKPVVNVCGEGRVIDKSSVVGTLTAGRRYLETIVAECGDVDISKQNILIAIGRGIQDSENVAIAQELAEALEGAVCCSRPVVDAKWMAKSRQVGSSGQTVKPKVYIACGISGSFQHLAGIKGNPFIVAINKNPKAPIFQVADVGIVADILEFLPQLTNKIRALQRA